MEDVSGTVERRMEKQTRLPRVNTGEHGSAQGKENMKEFQACAKEMLDFIDRSPSCYHTIANAVEILKARGFRELKEKEDWDLSRGEGFYVIRGDSSLIAFRLPTESGKWAAPQGFHIVASHSDSPAFQVKEAPEMAVEEHYLKLNTEKYGGMILSTWMDRALSIAGRVAVQETAGVVTKLVNIDSDLLVIPNLAIHMNRDMNKGTEYNPQVDMLPLYADCSQGKKENVLLDRIARQLGVQRESILGQDLYLYVREKGHILGENGEFVLSPRLDDLQCVFASMKAFSESRPKHYINVCAIFDNEEVGSGTRQGADSTFLEDVLWRTAECLGANHAEYLRMVAGSFLISADNAHGVHPNHPEKADPTNRPYLNGGVVIKYSGSRKYTTDAVSGARIRELCRKADVPCQTYANRSDVAGGTTLGHISTAHVSMETADIGLAQLAMHSAVETAGTMDTKYAVDMMKMFYKD